MFPQRNWREEIIKKRGIRLEDIQVFYRDKIKDFELYSYASGQEPMAGNCRHLYNAFSCIKVNKSLYRPEQVIRGPRGWGYQNF